MREQKKQKIHSIRVIGLLLAAVLFWSCWGNILLQTQAADSVASSISLNGSVPNESDGFWNGTAGNGQKNSITSWNLGISQNVSATGVTIQSSGQNVKPTFTNGTGTATAAYLPEEATFAVNFTTNVPNSLGDYSVKYRQNSGYNYKAEYKRFSLVNTRTYYKLITDPGASDTFATFGSKIKKNYTGICSNSRLMTKETAGGRAFSTAITKAADEVGASLYQSGMKLPLMVDEKEVVRIDMVTVSEGNIYMSGAGRWTSFKQTNIYFDYDVAVFQTHSYNMNNTADKAEAPTPVLESRKSVTGGISEEDSLMDLSMNVPDGLSEAERTAYEEAYHNGKLQYVLSDQQITQTLDIDWQIWDGNPVALEGKKWLYVRVVPKSKTTAIWRSSDVAEYKLSYLTDTARTTTIQTTSRLQYSKDSHPDNYQADQVTLKTTEANAQILYTTNGSRVTLKKTDAATAQSGEGTYLQINGLWYECGEGVQIYTGPIELPYDKNQQAMVRTMVVADGKRVGDAENTHEIQKLAAASVKLESGSTDSQGSLIVKLGDRITDLWTENPHSSGSAAAEYAAVAEKTTIQYYFSSNEEQVRDLGALPWKTLGIDESLPLELPETEDRYLYVRMTAPTSGFSRSYVDADVALFAITYPLKRNLKDLTVTTIPETEVKDTGAIGTGTVKISVPDTPKAVMVYTLDSGGIRTTRVNDTSIRESLNQKASGQEQAVVKDDTGCYIRVDKIWYQCESSGEVLEYKDGIELTEKELSGDGTTIHVIAAADGYVLKTAEVSYKGLETPTITLESGKEITKAVSQDDTIISLTHAKAKNASLKLQYYLTDQDLEEIPETENQKLWDDWNGTAVSLDRSAYLYVRTYADAGGGYMTSVPQKYKISYLSAQTGNVSAKTYVNGEEINGGVDLGDQIELIELFSTESSALIFYTTDGSSPVFEKVQVKSSAWNQLTSGEKDTSCTTKTSGSTLYVRVNGLWYQCGDKTLLYDKAKKITVDESIYIDNFLTINAQAVADGYVIGTSNRFSYSVSLREQAPTPTASVADGETIKMGDRINLLCNEGNVYRIFYTTNGSAPVVNIVNGTIETGPGTKEFTASDPLRITTDFAVYGSTVTITAIACRFGTNGNQTYRVMKDSAIARFTYTVEDQAAVEPVLSIPATSSENRTTVKIGSKIRLYSNTEGVVIFYTMDGTEPRYGAAEDGSGMEAKNEHTKKYSASQGITVPEIGDSSIITITAVAYCEGLANSDISRLIFQYPAAVTAPYATPSAGAVTENTQVTLKTATEGAVIYYEVAYGNDTPKDPTEDSNVYDSSNPFVIGKKTTIKAYAVKDGMKSEIVTFAYTVSDKLSVPTPSIDTGAVVASGTVIQLKADKDSTIYYTVDGSDPKKSENKNVLIGTNVILSGKAGDVVSLRTYASRTGYSDSEVGYYSYSISGYDGGIFADKETGSTVKNGEVIHLNTDVSNAKIYYTTDGSTPTESSTQGSAVTIQGTPGENITIKAIAVASGTDKAVSAATFIYQILDKLAAPTASVPDGAVFTSESVVELTAEMGKIYYTTNGEDPTTASNLYKKNITVNSAVTIKAIAVAEDYQQSEISTFSYGFASQVSAPVASFASGELDMGTEVAFTCETEGASIYYRTDGAEPDLNDKNGLELYTGPLEINRATNFKVVAVKDHMQNSKVLTVGYTVREPEVIVEAETEETTVDQGDNGRLMSRRSYSDTESGPSYTDVVLKNATYGVVVASEEGIIQDNAQLKVDQVKITDTSERMVKQMLSDSYGVVAGYEVELQVNGEAVQPDGEIEIGLPIPAEYENTLIQIVYLAEDGSVQFYSTRRSGGVAYIKTNHLSTYAIAAPVEFQESGSQFPWLLVGYSTAVALTAVGILLFYRVRKMKREDEEEDG